MKLLFFFAHPAKFHLFQVTINHLKSKGHEIDVIITGRPVLEELVKAEGWKYTKIFPKGRKIAHIHIFFSAVINSIRMIIKLLIFTFRRKYDLYITSDFLTIVGRLRNVPSILFTDDDLSGAPNTWILLWSANHMVAPMVCDLGKYNRKKIGFLDYKALAHLHPNHFKPDESVLRKYNLFLLSIFSSGQFQ